MIFKFYPTPYVRMYFTAPSMEIARTMGVTMFERFFEDRSKYMTFDDAEEIREMREAFDEGFAELEEAELFFVDAMY